MLISNFLNYILIYRLFRMSSLPDVAESGKFIYENADHIKVKIFYFKINILPKYRT